MEVSNGFCLRWDRFADIFKGNFSHLLKNENFTDVSLYCEGQLLNCHRVILSASSAYFRNLLLEVKQPNPVLILKDVRLEDLKCLLSFVYTGEVTVLQDQLSRVVKLGEALKIRGLGEDEETLDTDTNDADLSCVESEPKRRKVAVRPEQPQVTPQVKVVNSKALPQSKRAETSTSLLSSSEVEFVKADPFATDTESVTFLKHEEHEEEDNNANETYGNEMTSYNEAHEDSSEQPDSEDPLFHPLTGQDKVVPSGSKEGSVDGTRLAVLSDELGVPPYDGDELAKSYKKLCRLCGRNFADLKKLCDHYQTYHAGLIKERYLYCSACDYRSKTWAALSKHISRQRLKNAGSH